MYKSPGNADNLNNELLTKWNDIIENIGSSSSRFFKINHIDIQQSARARIEWFGDPLEPTICMGDEIAQQLCDWKGNEKYNGRELHNEYVEYAIIRKGDSNGKLRPKRVQITTELPEYWICIATYDPIQLRNMVENILGHQPKWEDLYEVSDPFSLSEEERGNKFQKVVGAFSSKPTGKIFIDNSLFMIHSINTVSSLIGLVKSYSYPYNIVIDGKVEKCTLEQLLHSKAEQGATQLACRHADPIALMAAYSAVFKGKDIAFDDPFGIYIQTFDKGSFTFQDEPIPENWVKFSRGEAGTNGRANTFQRLDFGPSDEENVFLDDIRVDDLPLLGGYQILTKLTVGPLIISGIETQISETEYKKFRIENPNSQEISCNNTGRCGDIKDMKIEYDNEQAQSPVAE